MSKNIAFVGFELPDNLGKNVSISFKTSLLDYDIVIFVPNFYSMFQFSDDQYRGKTCLNDTKSFLLKEQLEHWKREILDAVRIGKTVFILASPLHEVYIATGEKQNSGTGRNQKTIRIVSLTDNYKVIPDDIIVTNTNGNKMILDPKAVAFSDYWVNYGNDSSYCVTIQSKTITKVLTTKHGDRIVGGYYKSKNNGALVILPYINLEREEFTEQKNNGLYWSAKGMKYTNGFISNIIKLAESLQNENVYTPAPDWIEDSEYDLKSETKIRQKLLNTENKITELKKKLEEERKALSDAVEIKALLYEKGKPLEVAIIKGLTILGFKAESFKESDSEFDVVFISEEGRFIGEAEGKDNKAINVDKLRQLEMNINEDFSRGEVENIAKAVLFGNAFRLQKPSKRDCFFTEKCQTAATRSNTALLPTPELYKAVQYLSDHIDENYAKKCRKTIINTVGIITMPTPPETEKTAVEIKEK